MAVIKITARNQNDEEVVQYTTSLHATFVGRSAFEQYGNVGYEEIELEDAPESVRDNLRKMLEQEQTEQ